MFAGFGLDEALKCLHEAFDVRNATEAPPRDALLLDIIS